MVIGYQTEFWQCFGCSVMFLDPEKFTGNLVTGDGVDRSPLFVFSLCFVVLLALLLTLFELQRVDPGFALPVEVLRYIARLAK
jgi:hypothetical protein